MNRNAIARLLLLFLGAPVGSFAGAQAAKDVPAEIVIVGFTHLSQLNSGNAAVDVLLPPHQAALQKIRTSLEGFQPDSVMVEVSSEERSRLDAEYKAFCVSGTLPIDDARSETYQVGFAVARRLKLSHVVAVDFHDAMPQGMLASGTNVGLYQEGLKQLQTMAKDKNLQLSSGRISLYEYLSFLNRPETIELTHRLLFNTPAYVRDGDFKNPPQNVDMGHIDRRYIGAEFIDLFYNRNLKLYSNILSSVSSEKAGRILVLLGQTHVGVLQEMFRHNPRFRVVDASTLLP